MKLYSYWRSSTSYRVRAALNLKRLSYEIVPVDLVAGDQRNEAYLALNPGAGVPTLVLEDGTALTQSLAILDYLEAMQPQPRLIPVDPSKRARVLAAAHTVAMDIHPVNNLRLLAELKTRFGATPEQLTDWMQHWMSTGFATLETQLEGSTPFAFGTAPDIADLCIVAQLYNAHRWGLDLTPYPKLRRVETACLSIPEIAAAHPDRQPDAKVTT